MNTKSVHSASKKTAHHRVRASSLSHETQVSPLRVVDWLASGCHAVVQQPVLWLSILLTSADVATFAGMSPAVLPLTVFLAPMVVGALIFMQSAMSAGAPVSARETVAAVSRRTSAMCALGFYGAAIVAFGHVILLAAFHVWLQSTVTASGRHVMSIIYRSNHRVTDTLESLLGAWIFVVTLSATWFAPALVILQDMAPRDAILESVRGAARNWWATLVYSVLATTVGLVLPIVPLVLRTLVLTPLLIGVPLMSLHGAYCDIFCPASYRRTARARSSRTKYLKAKRAYVVERPVRRVSCCSKSLGRKER